MIDGFGVLPEPTFEGVESMQLTEVLRGGRQCDEDGTEIIMSRQACHEAANEIERLNLELQQRDKCSFMGPMRDCPTHGESKDAARYRWLKRQPWVKTKGIHAWGALLDDAIDEARHDAPDETPNVEHNRRPQGVRVDGPVGPLPE